MRHSLFALLLLSQAATGLATPIEMPGEEFRDLLKQTVAQAKSFEDRFAAEVWLVDMSLRMSDYIDSEQERLTILKTVHQEATRHELIPEMVLAVIHVESLFDRFAISRVGAQGLMQVMPFWKKHIGNASDNLTDIKTNIRYGCAILKTYLKMENGNTTRALARYNGSLGKTWYPERVFDAWQDHWFVQHQ